MSRIYDYQTSDLTPEYLNALRLILSEIYSISSVKFEVIQKASSIYEDYLYLDSKLKVNITGDSLKGIWLDVVETIEGSAIYHI